MTTPESKFICADDAEVAFYASFNSCDLDAMHLVWAKSDVHCVHPGSSLIIGYAAIMRSWEFIFNDSTIPNIEIKVLSRSVNDSLAVHVVEEHIATDGNNSVVLIATNIYQKFAEGWLIIEHHASPNQVPLDRPTLQ